MLATTVWKAALPGFFFFNTFTFFFLISTSFACLTVLDLIACLYTEPSNSISAAATTRQLWFHLSPHAARFHLVQDDSIF